MNNSGMLFLLVGPSGVGKSTLIKKLKEFYPGISFSVSYTTRQPRAGEIDGIHYHFISKEKFEEMIKNNEFLEYAQVHGNYYGTSLNSLLEQLNKNQIVLFEIDVQGVMSLKKKLQNVYSVFIFPPNLEELKTRLYNRNESEESIDIRIRTAEFEFRKASCCDFWLLSQNIDECYEDLESIFEYALFKSGFSYKNKADMQLVELLSKKNPQFIRNLKDKGVSHENKFRL